MSCPDLGPLFFWSNWPNLNEVMFNTLGRVESGRTGISCWMALSKLCPMVPLAPAWLEGASTGSGATIGPWSRLFEIWLLSLVFNFSIEWFEQYWSWYFNAEWVNYLPRVYRFRPFFTSNMLRYMLLYVERLANFLYTCWSCNDKLVKLKPFE